MSALPWFLAVAALACAAALWLHGVAQRRSAMHTGQAFASAAEAGAAPPQEPTLARALLAGLIPAVQAGIYVDALPTGQPRARLAAALAEQWGVRTPGDLRATLAWLLQQGDRGTYRQVAHIATSVPRSGWPAAVRALGEDCDHEQLQAWAANLAGALPTLRHRGLVRDEADVVRGISAWDMARAIQLARLGHDTTLVATGEAWMAIEQAAAHVYGEHASWREAAVGYLLGQAMMDGPGAALDDACDVARACLDDGASPWRRHPFAVRPRRAPAGRLFDQPAHPPAA